MRLVLALLALPLVASAQRVTPFSEPVSGRAEGGGQQTCVAHDAVQVCRVATDAAGAVVVRRNGRETMRWAASAPGVYEAVHAFYVDGVEGGRALVVAVLEAVSNGLAIDTWTVAVVPDGATAPAYTFVSRSFGTRGESVAGWRGQPVVWATEWLDSEDPSGRRGRGFYLVGRPFVLGRAGLAPVPALPLRARRLLADFRSEPGGPVAWLSSRRGETRRGDALGVGRPAGETGLIERVDADQSDPAVTRLTVRVGPTRRTVTLGDGDPAARLGDTDSGRLFPPGYAPSDLTGRTVRVAAPPNGPTVLWLD